MSLLPNASGFSFLSFQVSLKKTLRAPCYPNAKRDTGAWHVQRKPFSGWWFCSPCLGRAAAALCLLLRSPNGCACRCALSRLRARAKGMYFHRYQRHGQPWLPSERIELGFRSGGTVSPAFRCRSARMFQADGDLLVALDDGAARLSLSEKRLALQDLISPDALINAEIARLNAQGSAG